MSVLLVGLLLFGVYVYYYYVLCLSTMLRYIDWFVGNVLGKALGIINILYSL